MKPMHDCCTVEDQTCSKQHGLTWLCMPEVSAVQLLKVIHALSKHGLTCLSFPMASSDQLLGVRHSVTKHGLNCLSIQRMIYVCRWPQSVEKSHSCCSQFDNSGKQQPQQLGSPACLCQLLQHVSSGLRQMCKAEPSPHGIHQMCKNLPPSQAAFHCKHKNESADIILY